LYKDPGKRLDENKQDKGGQLKKLTWGTSPRNGGSKFGFPGKPPLFPTFRQNDERRQASQKAGFRMVCRRMLEKEGL
jgi:hypothetical protein